MNKLIFAAAAMAAMTALSGGVNAQTVRIATEGAYAPWNFVDESGKPAGYEMDLAKVLCEKAALDCEIVVNDWDSIIPNLLAGNYDAIMAGMSITEERLQTINFSDSYYPPDPSLFAAPAGANLDFANLADKRIGVQTGTIQAAYAEANYKTSTIVTFATADQAMADLASGNLDTVLADGAYVQPVVDASNGALEIVGDEILIGEGMGIGLRKEDTDLKAKLDAALTELKKDGTVDKLIAQWFDGAGPYFAE